MTSKIGPSLQDMKVAANSAIANLPFNKYMTSYWQRSLFPKRRNDLRPFLQGLEPVADECADFANGVHAQVGQFPLLQVTFARSAKVMSEPK